MDTIAASLRHLSLKDIRYFDRIGSTNDEAVAWLKSGAADLSLVVADEQTAGRGRFERRWFTPPGSALAFSLVLREIGNRTPHTAMKTTGLGAVAVCEALESAFNLHPKIKWPNDVLLAGKKTAGILAEAFWQGEELEGVILGIGINVAPPSVPPSAAVLFPATCVEENLPRRPDAQQPLVERIYLLAKILERVLFWRTQLESEAFMQAWKARLAYVDEWVQVYADLEKQPAGQTVPELEGRLLGVEMDGSLLIAESGGTIVKVQYGDLRLRPI